MGAQKADDWWLFPKCFFGNTAQTKDAWGTIAKRAWQEGTFAPIFPTMEYCSIHDSDRPIVVWNDDRLRESTCEPKLWTTNDDVWQLNWVLEEHPASFEDLQANAARHAKLLLEGLDQFWFAVGLLEGNPGHIPFLPALTRPREGEQAAEKQFVWDLLGRFARWLPAMTILDGRFAIASGRRGKGIKPVRLGQRLGLILDLLMYCDKLTMSDIFHLVSAPPEKCVETVLGFDYEKPWS